MSKYLFVVHSSITLRMARAIIRENKFEKNNCIFLMDRGFLVENSTFKVLDITPYFIRPIRWRERKQFKSVCRNNRQQLRDLYLLLESEVGTPFQLFIPHTRPYVYLAMVRHPFCEQYAFVEEGMLSYRDEFYNYVHQTSIFKRILLQAVIRYCLGPGFRAFPESLSYKHPKYAGCYGISKATFPTLPEHDKHIVPPPFDFKKEYAAIRNLMVAGPWIEKGYCTIPEYKKLKRALFRYWTTNGIDTLHVKFHPRQYHEQVSIVLFRELAEEFADRIKVIELPQEASPEEIAFSSRADFYLAHSSSTIYASQFGCRVFSYAKTMWKYWPASRTYVDHLPSVITDNMIVLDLAMEDSAD